MKNGTVNVRREAKTSGETTQLVEFNDDLDAESFKNPARVRVAGGITSNEGDFNSLRVDVAVEMPCLATPEEVARCYAACSSFVSEKLAEQIDLARNG